MVNSWFGIGQPPERVRPVGQVDFKRVGRFYVKVKQPKTIIFLDDLSKLQQAFVIFEHNPTIDGQFYHYFTCANTIDCYLCSKGNRAYQTYFLTVIEQDRQDATKWYKVLFPIKRTAQGNFPAWEKLEKKLSLNKLSTLKYAMFLVDRYDQKESAVGSEFDYTGSGQSIIAGLQNKELSTPFDYASVLQPKPNQFFIDLEKQNVKILYIPQRDVPIVKKPNTQAIQY